MFHTNEPNYMLLKDYSKSEYLQTGPVHKKGSVIPPGKGFFQFQR